MTATTETTGRALFAQHVAAFNEGVRSGDFGAMVARMTDDAELVFVGIPVGPFHGREAIAAAYAEQPPDDTITVLDVTESEGRVVGGYAWDRAPGVRAGELEIVHDGKQISAFIVRFA